MTSPIELYCDGSGEERVERPGGWAFVIVRDGEVLHEGHGFEEATTSLIMELEAARAGLEAIIEHGLVGEVTVISDCRIALEVAAGTFRPKPTRYHALCDALRAAAVRANAKTRWIRGHVGHRLNELVDARAHEAKLQGVARRAARKSRRRAPR
ncbi:MAG: reverse transcriptase-like protein [Archangiaceae bacterium]|nr:reverse transcriptase-like protein [Archangiaceae bacterium]